MEKGKNIYNINILKALFVDAKGYDELSEWEFCQTIMRDKYSDNSYELDQILNDKKLYDNLCQIPKKIKIFDKFIFTESIQFLFSIFTIIDQMPSSEDKFRIMLLSYCYITETLYFYNVITNLLWISCGKTFYINPFNSAVINQNLSLKEKQKLLQLLHMESIEDLIKPYQKVILIKFLSEKTNHQNIGKIFELFFDNKLRNAFYHSSYIFNDKVFLSLNNEKIIKYDIKEVIEKIKIARNIFENLLLMIEKYRKEYNKTVKIKGRKINYQNNNIVNSDETQIVDCYIVANERLGIINTMQVSSKDDKCNCEDSDKLMTKLIEVMTNCDIQTEENL